MLLLLNPGLTKMALFDIAADPSESHDLSRQFPEKVDELFGLARDERTSSEIFRFGSSAYKGEN